jgi:hypothetical protein
MAVVQLVPIVLSLLVLGAHFLRAQAYLFVGAILVLIVALPAIRRAWVARTVQVVLVLGALEWVRTVMRFAAVRMEMGQPYLRLVFILGTVILVTLLSAALFQTRTLRRVYELEPEARE